MDNGEADETVTLRRDMRNPNGGLLLAVLGIASPDSGGVSDLEAVPNPVIWSGQILDPSHDVKRFEVKTEVLKQGRQMAYSRSTIVDADNPSRVLEFTEGQGVSIGVPPEGLQKMQYIPLEIVDFPTFRRCGRPSAEPADPTDTGYCPNCRPKSPPPTPRCTSARSSSSSRPRRSTSHAARRAPTDCRARRHT